MENDKSTIKHLVITSGGTAGFTMYVILREANKHGLWDIKNIESIYGTSAGAIVAICIALKYEWEELDNYFLNRPWEHVYKIGIDNIMGCFDSKGIFGKKIFEEMLYPLLKGKDLEPSITLRELYEYSNIDIHFFTTEVHSCKSVDISYKTHPDWKLVDAMYCSACVPVVFMPFLKDDNCYSDGAITNCYPIYECLESGANPNEIFGIKSSEDKDITLKINEQSSLVDFLLTILIGIQEQVILARLYSVKKEYKIKHEITLKVKSSKIMDIINVMRSKTELMALFDKGIEIWNDYAKTLL